MGISWCSTSKLAVARTTTQMSLALSSTVKSVELRRAVLFAKIASLKKMDHAVATLKITSS